MWTNSIWKCSRVISWVDKRWGCAVREGRRDHSNPTLEVADVVEILAVVAAVAKEATLAAAEGRGVVGSRGVAELGMFASSESPNPI